jgi:hypothetical protein
MLKSFISHISDIFLNSFDLLSAEGELKIIIFSGEIFSKIFKKNSKYFKIFSSFSHILKGKSSIIKNFFSLKKELLKKF